MKEYQVVMGQDAAELKINVDAALSKGWQLVGGVSVSTVMFKGQPVGMLFQAMGK